MSRIRLCESGSFELITIVFFLEGGERFVSLAFFAEMKIFAVTVGVKSLGILFSGVVSKGVSGYPIRIRVVFF